ncbi:hypothetical protein STEG23_017323, partial [Scotinomys teguina]
VQVTHKIQAVSFRGLKEKTFLFLFWLLDTSDIIDILTPSPGPLSDLPAILLQYPRTCLWNAGYSQNPSHSLFTP